jgi:hypothetical protein
MRFDQFVAIGHGADGRRHLKASPTRQPMDTEAMRSD